MRRGAALPPAAALVAALAVWHPARVAVQTLLLLPALFPSAPLDPLEPGHGAPAPRAVLVPLCGGTVEATSIQPAGGGRHGAMMLLLGAGDLPRSDVAVHFAEALARLGSSSWCPSRRACWPSA